MVSYRSEAYGWTREGSQILSSDNLEVIRNTLENEGPVIMEHWFYRGSRSPDRLVFDDFDVLLAYVHDNARPGDAFYIWSFAALCRDNNTIAHGKYPDQDGCVPRTGAY